MTPSERTRGTYVECFGRADLPAPAAGRRDHIEARLTELSSAGVVESFDVASWPKRMPADGSGDADMRDRYLSFAAWARENDVRLTPFFGTRECYSMATGERGDWVVFPALALAVYEDGDLAAVYPHADGDTYRSVLSGLCYLEDAAESASPDSVPASTAD
jgi:hypothetical protein